MPKGRYRKELDLIDRLEDLEKRISTLERTPQAHKTGVNTGNIILKGGVFEAVREDGEGLISIGSNNVINGDNGMSIQVVRSQSVKSAVYDPDGSTIDGQPAMTIATVDGAANSPLFMFPTIQIFDKSGAQFFADSNNARRGMSDPILHQTFTQGTYTSSTSTSFAFIMSAECYSYHPHFRLRLLVQNDVGNSSELRLTENGGTFSKVVSMPAGAFQYQDITVPISQLVYGNVISNPSILNLEHRRVAGAGTIRTQIISLVGIDLSWSEFY